MPSAYYCDVLYLNLCILSYLKFPCSHFEGKGNAIQTKSIPAVKMQVHYIAHTSFTTFHIKCGLIIPDGKCAPNICHLRLAESLNEIKFYSFTWLIYTMFSQTISLISSGLKQAQPASNTLLWGMTWNHLLKCHLTNFIQVPAIKKRMCLLSRNICKAIK